LRPGDPFIVAGTGEARGDGKSGGTVRAANPLRPGG
jgi:hypothetical protein